MNAHGIILHFREITHAILERDCILFVMHVCNDICDILISLMSGNGHKLSLVVVWELGKCFPLP